MAAFLFCNARKAACRKNQIYIKFLKASQIRNISNINRKISNKYASELPAYVKKPKIIYKANKSVYFVSDRHFL